MLKCIVRRKFCLKLAFKDLVLSLYKRTSNMRYRVIQVWLVCLAITLFSPEAALSRAVMPTLEGLTRTASLIVVAQVENVTEDGGVRVATARVMDVWKGRSKGIVRFRASRSWTCDASTAIPGETVVLFLAGDAQTDVMAIAYSGMGRLPVNDANGTQTVELYSSLFTKALKQEAGLPQETFTGHVTLAMLKKHVQQITQGHVRKQQAA